MNESVYDFIKEYDEISPDKNDENHPWDCTEMESKII